MTAERFFFFFFFFFLRCIMAQLRDLTCVKGINRKFKIIV